MSMRRPERVAVPWVIGVRVVTGLLAAIFVVDVPELVPIGMSVSRDEARRGRCWRISRLSKIVFAKLRAALERVG